MDLSDKRSSEFSYPVMLYSENGSLQEKLWYCRTIEDADDARREVVQRRRESERVEKPPVRLKRRSVRGRMK